MILMYCFKNLSGTKQNMQLKNYLKNCYVRLEISVKGNKYQLSHGSEYNMTNIFRVSGILLTCFTSPQASEIKAKYEKQGKY